MPDLENIICAAIVVVGCFSVGWFSAKLGNMGWGYQSPPPPAPPPDWIEPYLRGRP